MLQLLEEHITENIVKASYPTCDFHIVSQRISSRLDGVIIVRSSGFPRDLFYRLSSVPSFTEISRRGFLVSLKTFTVYEDKFKVQILVADFFTGTSTTHR